MKRYFKDCYYENFVEVYSEVDGCYMGVLCSIDKAGRCDRIDLEIKVYIKSLHTWEEFDIERSRVVYGRYSPCIKTKFIENWLRTEPLTGFVGESL